MTTFESMHQEKIVGKLTMVDRVIFKGYLNKLFRKGAFKAFLWKQGVPLKNFKAFAPRATEELKAHAQAFAQKRGRPYLYLEGAHTAANGNSKEDLARRIAEEDGITEGLVCVLSALEPSMSFKVRPNRETYRLEAVRAPRNCLHFYFYYIDPEFGFMHVRLQSWFPFDIQVYVNGREWLARQLDRLGIGYQRYDNALLAIDDLPAALRLCEQFRHRPWHRVLSAFARAVNPWLPKVLRLGFGAYYWVTDQCEVATDVMFRDRASLNALLPELFEHAALRFSAEDVMRFLGRKLNGNFLGQVTTDSKRRPEGRRIKHRMKRNSIKIYDKYSVLRIETTINNPREFKVLRLVGDPLRRRWCPMGKGVSNMWRYLQVAEASNDRYLEALAQVQPQGEAVRDLDGLCRSRTVDGKHHARFNPVASADCALFAAALAGEHAIHGFRNHDLAARLYRTPARTPEERKRRCARVSRLIAKMRGHGLVAKVPYSRLYRVTPAGARLMAGALRFRHDFPSVASEAA